MQADIPEIKRREHDTNSGNKKANLYYWNTDTLSWTKLSGTSSGINVVGGGGGSTDFVPSFLLMGA